MRHGLFAAVLGAAVVAAGAAPASAALLGMLTYEDYPERDEIRESYKLSPGASVTIADISGPVEVETWDGDTAELHVVRSAPTREELDRKRILVEHTPTSLAIYTEKRRNGMGWDRSEVRQSVSLKLPRSVDLSIMDVAGAVRVGSLDGDLTVTDVAGRLSVGTVSGVPQINDVAGSVELAVGSIGAKGIRINDVAGRVELRVAALPGAEIDIHDVSGRIDVDVPNVTLLSKLEDREVFRGRVGDGGPPIAIHDIAGSVTVRAE